MFSLESLPAHVLDMIIEKLTVEDVSRLSRSCSSLYTIITTDNQLWRRFCEKTWLCCQLSDGCPTWYAQWLQWCKEFGRYKTCYANVKGAWTRIEANLQVRCPAAYDDIMRSAPVTEAEIDGLEQRLGVELPNDYRCSLRIHGSKTIRLGTTRWYYFETTYDLLGMDSIRNFNMEMSEGGKAASVVIAEGRAKIKVPGISEYLCQALLMGVDKGDGVVPRAVNDDRVIPRGHIVDGYFRETYMAVVRGIEKCSHYARSESSLTFEDWIMREAQNIDNYFIVNQQLTRFLHHPTSYVAVTGHFTVKVATAHDPTFGSWQHPGTVQGRIERDTGYSYHIVIEMAEGAPEEDSCQLLRRYWEIQEDGEPVQVVDGEGVVGHQPIFHPGDRFEYASYNLFHYPNAYSSMSGHFVMRYLNRLEDFEVKINPFGMEQVPLTKFRRVHIL